MSYLSRLFGILAILSLSACGGGGGGGGSSLKLTDSDPLPRHQPAVIDVSGLTLSEETYPATLNGMETVVVRSGANKLVLLLPPQLDAGRHTLEVTVNEQIYRISFESIAPIIPSREDTLLQLDSLFSQLSSQMDLYIHALQDADADQALIDARLAEQSKLDINNPDLDELTDSELAWLADFLAAGLSTDSEQRARRSFSPECSAALWKHGIELAGTVAFIGAGVALGPEIAASLQINPILGVVAGAGAAGIIWFKATRTADSWKDAYESCFGVSAQSIEQEIEDATAPKTRKSIGPDTVVRDAAEELLFTVTIPNQYTLLASFDGPEEFREKWPDMLWIIDKISLLIPDEVEEFIRERANDDYQEESPVNQLSIIDINRDGISGEIIPVDENSFQIVFRVTELITSETTFRFTLYDALHDIATRYVTDLEIPEHCPALLPEGYYSALEGDTCYVVYPSESDVQYWEYRYRLQIRFERYDIGGTSLLTLKGLGDTDLPYVGVGMLRDIYRHTLFFSGDTFHAPLDVAEGYQDGGLKVVTQYSAPFKGVDGIWHTVAESMIDSVNGTKTREQQYSGALLNGLFGDIAEYVSVRSSDRIWIAGVLQHTETYSAPFFDNDLDQWRSYLTRYDDHVGDCYYLFNSAGDTTFDNCTPPEETP